MKAGFSLESDAFPVDGPDNCFVTTPALNHRLDLLHQLVQYGEKPLVLVAPIGAGKTTLLKRLIEDASMHWRTCAIEADPLLSERAVLAAVSACLSLPALVDEDETDQVLARIDAHLQGMARTKQLTLVAVDDADHLNQKTRGFIDQLKERWRACNVRFLYAREPDAEDRFETATSVPESDAATVVIDVPPLSVEQTDDYIHTRLSQAGLVGNSPFTTEVVHTIHKSSAGRPAGIHRLARQVVANQSTGTHPAALRSAGKSKRWARLALSLLVLSAAGGWATRGEFQRVGGPVGKPGDADRMVLVDVVPRPTTEPNQALASTQGAEAEPSTATALVELQMPEPMPDAVSTPAPEGGSSASAAAEITGPDPEPDTDARAPAVSDHLLSVQAVPVPVEEAPVAVPPETARIVSTPAPPPSTPTSPSVPQAPEVVEETVALAPVQTPEAQPGANDPLLSEASSLQTLRSARWLREQAPGSYAIQIMGSRDAEALQRFALAHRLSADAAWFTTTLAERPWHVLVYGNYPSRAEAISAIAQLPAALRAGGPFTRTIAEFLEQSTSGSQ